jgi:aflatoxin B1 aldehyde reductase
MPLLVQNPKDRIILGLMTFGPDADKGARVVKFEDFTDCLDLLQSEGYNEIDTARSSVHSHNSQGLATDWFRYVGGKQETWTGKAGWKDRGFTLATKHYPQTPGQHKPDLLKAALKTSLEELQADCVDIFYLHAADRSVPFKETLQAVNELHKDGRFVNLGLSNFTSFEVAEICMICNENGWVRPTVWQGKIIPCLDIRDPHLLQVCTTPYSVTSRRNWSQLVAGTVLTLSYTIQLLGEEYPVLFT